MFAVENGCVVCARAHRQRADAGARQCHGSPQHRARTDQAKAPHTRSFLGPAAPTTSTTRCTPSRICLGSIQAPYQQLRGHVGARALPRRRAPRVSIGHSAASGGDSGARGRIWHNASELGPPSGFVRQSPIGGRRAVAAGVGLGGETEARAVDYIELKPPLPPRRRQRGALQWELPHTAHLRERVREGLV